MNLRDLIASKNLSNDLHFKLLAIARNDNVIEELIDLIVKTNESQNQKEFERLQNENDKIKKECLNLQKVISNLRDEICNLKIEVIKEKNK